MSIEFTCPHCGTYTNVGDAYAGQSGACAACGKPIHIPHVETVAGVQQRGRVPWQSLVLAAATIGGLALLGLLIFCLILLATLGPGNLPLPGMRQVPVECALNLQQIGEAIDAYVADNGHYPPAYLADEDGQPMHSWRVLLLPYLGHDELFRQYDLNLPWDDPQNAALTAQMPKVYGCPYNSEAARGETCFMAIRGPGLVFDGTARRHPSEITDPRDKTILLVEVTGTGANWLEPQDLDVATMRWGINSQVAGWGSHHDAGGAQALLVDGSVICLLDVTPPTELQAMATVAGGEVCEPGNWEYQVD